MILCTPTGHHHIVCIGSWRVHHPRLASPATMMSSLMMFSMAYEVTHDPPPPPPPQCAATCSYKDLAMDVKIACSCATQLVALRVYSHQRRALLSTAEILLRIYQNPIHLNGARWRTTLFRRRTSRCLQNLVHQRVPFKCMWFWYIRSRISAAEKTRVFGVNRP